MDTNTALGLRRLLEAARQIEDAGSLLASPEAEQLLGPILRDLRSARGRLTDLDGRANQ